MWFYKFGLTGLLITFLCIAPFSVLPNVLKAQSQINRASNYEYQGILELWHVETFEGGSVSRATFLEREASFFEKQHKGTYISIQTMSLEQFMLNIGSGKKPNILSFGIGVGSGFLNNLIVLNASDVRNDISFGGKFNGKQMAVPYILGGYCLISKSEQTTSNNQNNNSINQTDSNSFSVLNANGKTGAGLLGTTNPLKSMQKNGLKIAKFYNEIAAEEMDTYTAYDSFIKEKFSALVGTQRDVFRCNNRVESGKMEELNFNFLGGWTDIVQYVSVFSASKIEEEMCKKFVAVLTCKDAQKQLSNYNLFSVLSNENLYEKGLFNTFENALKKPLEVENVFADISQINSQKQNAYSSVVL